MDSYLNEVWLNTPAALTELQRTIYFAEAKTKSFKLILEYSQSLSARYLFLFFFLH